MTALPVPLVILEPCLPEQPARTPSPVDAAAARADRAAFDSLHQRFAAGLRKLFLTRTSRPELADDLAQRTWLECWRSLAAGRYDPARAAFSTFLYAIGSNVWREHLRSRSRALAHAEGVPAEAEEEEQPPADELSMAELLDALRGCMRGEGDFTDEDRWILRAVAGGDSDRGMAQHLKVAPSTMNARKRAALEHLRRWLAQRGHRGWPERSAPENE